MMLAAIAGCLAIAAGAPAMAAAEEPASATITLTVDQIRHAHSLQRALAANGIVTDVGYTAPGVITLDRTPVSKIFTRAERRDLPRGVTHVTDFTFSTLNCPVSDVEVYMTGPDPAVLPADLFGPGRAVLIPRPADSDPKSFVMIAGSPDELRCLGGS